MEEGGRSQPRHSHLAVQWPWQQSWHVSRLCQLVGPRRCLHHAVPSRECAAARPPQETPRRGTQRRRGESGHGEQQPLERQALSAFKTARRRRRRTSSSDRRTNRRSRVHRGLCIGQRTRGAEGQRCGSRCDGGVGSVARRSAAICVSGKNASLRRTGQAPSLRSCSRAQQKHSLPRRPGEKLREMTGRTTDRRPRPPPRRT